MRIRFIASLAVLLLGGAVFTSAQSNSAEALLEAARKKEVVDGDLSGAIDAYRNLVDRHGANPGVAASALLYLARAYEALGNLEEARLAYERVVREHADRAEADSARARLAAMGPTGLRPGNGPVCTKCVGPFFHSFTLSTDGQWLGYTNEQNDLVARHLESGQTRTLVTFPTESYSSMRFRARRAIWSRDMRRLAYFFRDTQANGEREDRAELRVLELDGSKEPRTLVDNPDFIYVNPAAWSADGSAVLVSLQRRDRTWQLAWVSAATGTVTVLRSLNWQFDEFRNGPELSPDGQHILYATFTEPRTSAISLRGPARTIHILKADASRDVVMPAAVNGYASPVWSPDGARVLFLSDRDNAGDYDLWTVDVRDGTPVSLPRLVKASIGSNVHLVGSTRSGLLYYVQPETSSHRIVIAEIDGVTPTADSGVTTGFAGEHASWSPTGSHLAWLVSGRLKVRALESGSEATFMLPRGATVFAPPAWHVDGTAVIVGLWNAVPPFDFVFVRATLKTSSVETLGTFNPPADQVWNGEFTVAADAKTLRLPLIDRRSSERSLVAFDPAAGSVSPVLGTLAGLLRIQSFARTTVGQAMQIVAEPTPVAGIVTSPNGSSVAVELLKDGQSFIGIKNLVSGDVREVYGPVPLRQFEGATVSRLSQARWLRDGMGLALGVQQDDLSWKLVRIPETGAAEFLRTPRAVDFTLGPATLDFDINPDGRRVAYEQLMTFSDEVWALHLPSLLKSQP